MPADPDGGALWASLSKRERAIASRFAEGLTYQQISAALFIAPTTVRTHLTAIYSKLEVHNKAALKTYAAAAMDHTIAMLRGATDASLNDNIVQFGNRVTRGRALMELLDHFPCTLGQTVPYLRLNGVTPPEYSPF